MLYYRIITAHNAANKSSWMKGDAHCIYHPICRSISVVLRWIELTPAKVLSCGSGWNRRGREGREL